MIPKLKAIDPDINHWVKARSFLYMGYSHPFEIHFYYNTIPRGRR